MEPRIQYAQTSDGANIAWWSLGDGPAVIQLPSIPFTHIQMEWDDPNWRAWYLAFGEGFRLIRYDSRGCGLSSAPTFDYCLDAMLQDLVQSSNTRRATMSSFSRRSNPAR